jgi:endonuclease YncB( thermonuclease family)
MLSLLLFIVDGDTFHLQGEKIRLWGVDAPEISTQAGVDAKDYLSYLLSSGEVLCLPVDTDKYSRTVAQCWVGETDVACEMVKAGHAVDWPYFSHGHYKECEE